MTLALDAITLEVPQVRAAADFYSEVFAPKTAERGGATVLDLGGNGEIVLTEWGSGAPEPAGFGGWTLNFIVEQPAEVKAVLDAAERGGATVLKPATKSMFAGFTAVFRAPDGAIWKVASPKRKDTGPAGEPPIPTETVLLLAVADPKASKAFYEKLGLVVDRDYGDKFVDFALVPGATRLGLMRIADLAKDAGVDAAGEEPGGLVLEHRTATSDEAAEVLAAAAAAGGGAVDAAHFADPDGHLWKITAR
ncbi:VOC family protein [Glycomyces sp. NRRL B-16210]|uniref:VOC family protein n=1 Tax=Glycomyces sp. NRRL B-16210 TaxID=1463821 RepID=UPI0004C2123C